MGIGTPNNQSRIYPILPDWTRGNRSRSAPILPLLIIRYFLVFFSAEETANKAPAPNAAPAPCVANALAEGLRVKPIARRHGRAQSARSFFVFLVRGFIRRGCRIGIRPWRPRGRLVGPGFWRMLGDVHVALRKLQCYRSANRVPGAGIGFVAARRSKSKIAASIAVDLAVLSYKLRWQIYNSSAGSARK